MLRANELCWFLKLLDMMETLSIEEHFAYEHRQDMLRRGDGIVLEHKDLVTRFIP